ncbi:13517_t:CDS:2 [Cetraspora pellucida]|uniref:13517_t:CDS:1 n=1 Tax=Cetraspora pellucida TaxID=1433469 RepID=A0ACA9L947_9GLOM|nr:13517_t:CDS:2 [Cetraspora pellucida]
MAVDFEGSSEKIGKKNYYILRLYSSLINGQKAVVTLTGIQIFFDILVPNNESVSINDFQPVEDLKIISDHFLILALMRDRTLILTWDIETQL